MVRTKPTKSSYKVVQYRGGRVHKRSTISVPVRLLPRGASVSGFVQPSSSGSISFPDTITASSEEIEAEASDTEFPQEAEEEQFTELPQFGKQSLVKKRVRQYRKRKEAEIKAWSEIRESMLDRYVESEALPQRSICCYCSNSAECRCLDCGILKLMCVNCCTQTHKNSLHMPEIWKDDGFQMMEFDRGIWRKFNDSGLHGYVEEITVINSSGIQMKVSVMFYSDEEHCLTLVEYGLWPATPKEPKVAFELHLLELAEVLFLECRLSTKQFCNALKWMVPDLCQAYVKDIYHLLVSECFSEFRFMHHQFRTLKQLNPELEDDGTLCPACPRENGTLHISVDALFGCVRKKSSGESVAPPKHGETFFVSQEKVDLFTNCYGKKDRNLENDCNQFQAGTNLRSKVKSNKLDETAVFGCACRHEIPKTFFSLKRGEQ